MSEITFKVQGSESDPYVVTFAKDGANLTATCSCRAGKLGQYCKHRLNILLGDTDGMVGGDPADVAVVVSWLPGSDVEEALQQLAAAEAVAAKAQAEVVGLRKALGRKLSN